MTSEPRPIFIVGSPRSGTSVFTWCLGRHSNIILLPETNWIALFACYVRPFHTRGCVHGRYSHLSSHGISLETFAEEVGNAAHAIVMRGFEGRWGPLREKMRRGLPIVEATPLGDVPASATPLRIFNRWDDPKRRWVDGAPINSLYIPSLSLLFPHAKFIHIIRNPEKVVGSLVHFDKAGGRPYEVTEAINTWLNYTRACLYAESLYTGERVCRVHFDELIGRSEATLRRCLGFVGEDFQNECLEPLTKKINSSNVDDEDMSDLFQSLRDHAAFADATSLYNSTLQTDWQITEDQDEAQSQLAHFDSYRLPV